MDIFQQDGDYMRGYDVDVSSTDKNTITGTYENMDSSIDSNTYSIKITLFYKAPKLTVKITGKGPLAGQKFVVEPRLD